MSFIGPGILNDGGLFSPTDDFRVVGKELNLAYSNGEPFPHIVIDNFLPDELIDLCLAQFPQKLGADGKSFDRDQERAKSSFQPDSLAPQLRALFYAFNAKPFVRVIENITGISGLIPDLDFLGGGLHEIGNGGHLSMHADFNHHKRLNLERRVNVLIYLNRHWVDDFGGQLELWRTDMSEQVHSIVPIANRCVIFTTSATSMHGNPQPVKHPDGVSRKSIALYYYTASWDRSRSPKLTQFKPRPGTEDHIDWMVRAYELCSELAPPIIWRHVEKLRSRRQTGAQ